MRAWRLLHARWKEDALSGEGAGRYPGRWNHRGEHMVYLAGSLALAALETRVHMEVNATGTPYTAIQFEFPDELVQLVEPPAGGWREELETTRSMGSAWLKEGSGLVLAVPSAIISVEFNYLLNPLHPSHLEVRAVQDLDFQVGPAVVLGPGQGAGAPAPGALSLPPGHQRFYLSRKAFDHLLPELERPAQGSPALSEQRRRVG